MQLDVNKRFSNNWQGLVSYIYSKLDGNFDGEYAPFTNVGADPNISAAYDYYDFFTDGCDWHLHRRAHHQRRAALERPPAPVQVLRHLRHADRSCGSASAAYYRTGTPLTRYGFFDVYGRYEFFLTKRGAEGRQPDTYEADVHLGYPLEAGPVEINFLLDVFNILNAQRPILLDQRWGFQQADNASGTPVNPGYGQPLLRTGPTTVRLGIRISM